MAKKKEVIAKIKLQCIAGQATPAPPVGPALGQHGVNIGQFVQKFNDETKKQAGIIVPVKILVYKDKSFTFEVFSPPASVLLKKEAGIVKGAADPKREVAGQVTKAQIKKIVEMKQDVLRGNTLEQSMKIIEGTARSVGIQVVD